MAGLVDREDATGSADVVVTVEDGCPVLSDASGRRLVGSDDPLA
jgi:hypothetical protein